MKKIIKTLITILLISMMSISLVACVFQSTTVGNNKGISQSDVNGVKSDLRPFEVAFEQVAREFSGFTTFGWDTGDNGGGVRAGDIIKINNKSYVYTNAAKDAYDRVCNSYDEGDFNLNGVQDNGESWTGTSICTETWTKIYTLDNPGNPNDKSAYDALEDAINVYLGTSSKIELSSDGTFTTSVKDPWKNQYHGVFVTNALEDQKDRGAFVIISDGPDNTCNTQVTIENGSIVFGNTNDFYLSTIYTNKNGYAEVISKTELPVRTDN